MARERFFGIKGQGSVYVGDNAMADGDLVTLGDKIYEFDNNSAVTAGHIAVTIAGTAALTAANLIAAINANKPTVPCTATVDDVDAKMVHIIADAQGSAGNIALSVTSADANIVASGATLVNGENAGTQTHHRGTYTVTAKDVAATNTWIDTGLVSPRFPLLFVTTSAGVPKAITDAVTIVGAHIKIVQAGGTHLAAGDLVNWSAWE